MTTTKAMPLMYQKAALAAAALISTYTIDRTAFHRTPPAFLPVKDQHDYRILSGLREINGANAHGLVFKATSEAVKQLEFGPLVDRLVERARDKTVVAVEEALNERVKPALAAGETYYFFMQLHDRDLWSMARDDPNNAAGKALARFAAAHPNVFWLHWNPTIMDPARGHLGTNVIPIPDFEVMSWGAMGVLPKCADRRPGIVWRGSTTGRFGPGGRYTQTDRFRAVEKFMEFPGADVKFSKRAQGVTAADVPDAMLARGYNKADFAKFRVHLDVDGNSNAWSGLRWKLSHGANVVKIQSRGYAQWYYPLLVNGTHLRVSDVEDAPAAVAAITQDDAACDAMGAAARKFAEEHLRPARARAALFDALEAFKSYTAPRDWRIQGTK